VGALPSRAAGRGAFVAKEPCGCEPSRVVSVESVQLKPALEVSFELHLDKGDARR